MLLGEQVVRDVGRARYAGGGVDGGVGEEAGACAAFALLRGGGEGG